jgi:predicted transcriptional regulator
MDRKSRGGRPGREPAEGERVKLGLRVTPEVKRRLDAAAEQNGRSQSQEAEFRLERSFDRQDLLSDVLKAEFEPTLAGIILATGRIMSVHGSTAEALLGLHNYLLEAPPDLDDNWATDPRALELALVLAITFLTLLRPTEKEAQPVDADDRRHFMSMAYTRLRSLLDDTPKKKLPAHTINYEERIRSLLGPEFMTQLKTRALTSPSDLAKSWTTLADLARELPD